MQKSEDKITISSLILLDIYLNNLIDSCSEDVKRLYVQLLLCGPRPSYWLLN